MVAFPATQASSAVPPIESIDSPDVYLPCLLLIRRPSDSKVSSVFASRSSACFFIALSGQGTSTTLSSIRLVLVLVPTAKRCCGDILRSRLHLIPDPVHHLRFTITFPPSRPKWMFRISSTMRPPSPRASPAPSRTSPSEVYALLMSIASHDSVG